MTVTSVNYIRSVIIHTGSQTAMVTKWKTGTFGFRKTYHIVVLKGSTFAGLVSSTSAYVTDKIPKKQDLSTSTFHVDADEKEETLKDAKGAVICSFGQSDKVALGFKIEDAAFEKVDSISPELIRNLGEFLQKHLAETSSAPKAGGKKDEPKALEKAKAKDAPKPAAPSKGLTRPSLSNLCGRVAPLLVGFALTSLALAVSHFFSSEGNIDPAIGTTL